MATSRRRAIDKAVRLLIPAAPLADTLAIREAAGRRHMRTLPVGSAVWLATLAHVRHAHTDYDRLRDEGYDRDSAFFFLVDDINAVLTRWRATRLLNDEALSPDEVEALGEMVHTPASDHDEGDDDEIADDEPE